LSEVWRLIDFGIIDPYEYYTTLEAMVSSVGRRTSPNTITFLQMHDHVTLGTKTDITKKVKREYCKNKNIPVIRTTVPHDSSAFLNPDTLKCAIYINKETPPIVNEKLVYECYVAALEGLGFPVTHPEKSNNLVYNGKKVGVVGTVPFRKVLYIGVNVFIASSVDEAEKAIISPKDMRVACTSLSGERGELVSVNEVREAIIKSLVQIPSLKFELGGLSVEEEVLSEKLMEKYTSEQWIETGRWSPVKDYGLR